MKGHPVISIIGGTVWGNRGAESMLVTVIGKLRETHPHTKFNVFTYYPTKDRELVTDESVRILSGKPVSLATRHFIGAILLAIFKKVGLKVPTGDFFKIAWAISESDLLLDIGGITFSDGREKYLPFNILTIWPAFLLGVPVVKMAQAVGPFRRWMNRLSAKIFLFRCAHIFARGEKTAEFLKDLHFPDDCFDTVADIAFLFLPEFSLSEENNDKVDGLVKWIRQEKKIGKEILIFSPSILVEQESSKMGLNYAKNFLDVIRDLGTDSYSYVFIPNATRELSEKAHNNDLLVINHIREMATNSGLSSDALAAVEWVNYDINSASIRKIIGESDVLVTSRYHAMISGLALMIPTIVIGWGHKYRETMTYFDLQKYSLDFSDTKIDLTNTVVEILEKNSTVRKQIKTHLPDVKAKSETQFSYLTRVLS
jgi:polysaccharide pyruvyl transferase WcaK-like protein